MKKTRESLVIALSRLSLLYPSMRLGQLLEMLATMAGADSIASFDEISDECLLQAASHHVADRANQLEICLTDSTMIRSERRLLLAKFSTADLNEPLLHAVCRFANEGGSTVYDIEDADMLTKFAPHSSIA